MSIIGLFIILIVLGLAVWLMTSFIPMPQAFKSIILVVAILIALLVILQAFGILGTLNVRVPQIR